MEESKDITKVVSKVVQMIHSFVAFTTFQLIHYMADFRWGKLFFISVQTRK